MEKMRYKLGCQFADIRLRSDVEHLFGKLRKRQREFCTVQQLHGDKSDKNNNKIWR
jgi:hypothetical protein